MATATQIAALKRSIIPVPLGMAPAEGRGQIDAAWRN
jgi:hypothetical protein